jgi:hypothetical protein
LHNDKWVIDEAKEEIKSFLELMTMKCAIYNYILKFSNSRKEEKRRVITIG